ncbi:MAG: hypothetical protein U0235_05120 [Polyangiaceae bacterium]
MLFARNRPLSWVLGLGSLVLVSSALAAPPSMTPTRPRPSPRASSSAAPAPTCGVTVTGATGAVPTCTGATAKVVQSGGAMVATTTIAFGAGATATFTSPGMPTAGMHTGSEAGFGFDVTLAMDGKKWTAKREPTATSPTSTLLRFTTFTQTGSGADGLVLAVHGYAVVALDPVKESGADKPITLRVDF